MYTLTTESHKLHPSTSWCTGIYVHREKYIKMCT